MIKRTTATDISNMLGPKPDQNGNTVFISIKTKKL